MKKTIIISISALLIVLLASFIIYNLFQSNKSEETVETIKVIDNYNDIINETTNENKITNTIINSNEVNNDISKNNVKNQSKNADINNKKDNNKKENKKNGKKIYKKADETVYAITTVHIRAKDNEESNIIATVSLGDVLQRIAIGNNGWSKIKYNNIAGYISTQYISKEKPPKQEKVTLNVDPNRKIDPSKPMVALTFDDGPNPNSTPKILNTLEKYKSVATFFDIGKYMKNYPQITQKEEAIGCEVGSHTYAHKNLDTLSKNEILEDIKMAEDIYKETLGHDLLLVRPPYGNANSIVKLTLNYPLINWDVDTMDWKTKDKKSIIAEVNKIGNLDGRIILMHSIYKSTADAVAKLVPQLLKKGYQLVTISELAKYKQIELKTHTSYWGFK